ncbi:hypothetical protein P886_1263 [Alteromonadaceae bacterium 2753L.S.0a.02]|nr:hypothetical protein P886_1263 [Alteromonadaceae bacterium 2753L.S.0a.02]
MYLSRRHLAKVENISESDAKLIWDSNYYSGWFSPLSISFLMILVLVLIIFGFSSWLIPLAVLICHLVIAYPLSSKNMKIAVRRLQK